MKIVKLMFVCILAGTCALAQTMIKGKTNTGSFERASAGIVANDFRGPEITLTEPTAIATRGFKVMTEEPDLVTSNATIVIKGIVKDTNGVAMVKVNGQEAILESVGDAVAFQQQVLLKLGKNDVEVRAWDPFRNERWMSMTVKREATVVIGSYHALIIAVQDYQDPGIRKLSHPIGDAERLIRVLTEEYSFDNTTIEFLKNPDRSTIIKSLTKLSGKLTEDDNLLVFFAGHGVFKEEQNEGFWLPRNASPDDESDWLPNSQVRNLINAIKTKHTLLIADACFSGSIFAPTRAAIVKLPASVEVAYKSKSRKAITSGAKSEVPDKSVFVDYLIKRLRENQDEFTYAQKLYVDLKDAVINNSPNHQAPEYGPILNAGDEGSGDFVFKRKSTNKK